MSAILNKAFYQASPADPTGTTSTSGVMMGLAGSITPRVSGVVLFIISGYADNTTAADGIQVGGRYGTGTAPSNGGAGAGAIVFGALKHTITRTDVGGGVLQFTVQGVVTGLVVGTTYWIDLFVNAITGGTASVANISITAAEL